jgi:hypothetical protein
MKREGFRQQKLRVIWEYWRCHQQKVDIIVGFINKHWELADVMFDLTTICWTARHAANLSCWKMWRPEWEAFPNW